MRYFLFLFVSVLIFSCRKDPKFDIEIPYEPDSVEIINTTGSWWKYEWYEIDSLGNETLMGEQDCVYVVGDTLINNKTYTHYRGGYYPYSSDINWYYRDSSHYLVNSHGDKLFSTYDRIDTMNIDFTPQYNIYRITDGKEHTVNLPAGTFSAYEQKNHYHKTDSTAFTPCDSIYIKTLRFANGIGFISEQSAFISALEYECKYMERRLLEYNIGE